MGRPPGALASDLETMATLFGSGTKPRTLKDRVYALAPADEATRRLPSGVCLLVDDRALITPEGRILLDVLLELRQTGSLEIDLEHRCNALEVASDLRRGWYANWLGKQFGGSLSAPVLGAALFLLINGSIGEERALTLPLDDDSDRRLGSVVLPVIANFSERLGGRVPDTSGGVLKHWAFTQVSRLLGRDVARLKSADGSMMFVRTGHEAAFLDDIATRLERSTAPHKRVDAVVEFVADYRRVRGYLATLGQMYEDPTRTQRIINRVSSSQAIS